jgi:hypothetical protein
MLPSPRARTVSWTDLLTKNNGSLRAAHEDVAFLVNQSDLFRVAQVGLAKGVIETLDPR